MGTNLRPRGTPCSLNSKTSGRSRWHRRKTRRGRAGVVGSTWLAANVLIFPRVFLPSGRRVTPADLQRVARAYLVADNRTVYALLPAGAAPKPSVTSGLASENAIQKFEL